ncbi:MAG: flagellar biosynthesis protein FlhB [Defluviicoccus sp.]|nr:flagellar biosynthesis protein FlhB [Defluviicoccus sp.]MDG4593952.1 flagellar biosynthesis protein FlhB [Defluviicoccus sp.]MDS4073554.1 flagellar biosynthesis protein FlhB [Defluviicoccus sp.]
MAETEDESKTEEPTARRLQQGRERGQVAVSQDIKTWGGLVGTALALAFLVPPMGREATALLLPFIDHPEAFRLESALLPWALIDLVLAVGRLVAPILGLMLLVGIGLGVAQVGLLWAPDKVAPKASRLSPLAGIKRILSLSGVAEFAKGLVKIGIVVFVFLSVTLPLLPHIDALAAIAPAAALARLHDFAVRFAGATAAVIAVLAVVDYLFQRLMFLKQMRMTRQEIRDEHRDSEGDPHIKARIRQLRTQRARQRMMAAVPQADVVITNPTHYAVALKYDMEKMAAPKLVAKGTDLVARRIRELAEAHDVPIVENPPLARALHGSVEIDGEVPPSHYEAVARVIGYVMRLKQGRR